MGIRQTGLPLGSLLASLLLPTIAIHSNWRCVAARGGVRDHGRVPVLRALSRAAGDSNSRGGDAWAVGRPVSRLPRGHRLR